MNAITIEQLYELFADTANRCSSSIVSLSDEEIEYNLFEEFDVGVRSFFHDDNVRKLIEAGMIDRKAGPICHEIRSGWIELDGSNWTIDEIKHHPEWKRLFSACDKLLEILKRQD